MSIRSAGTPKPRNRPDRELMAILQKSFPSLVRLIRRRHYSEGSESHGAAILRDRML
jgi:hypothetical protein